MISRHSLLGVALCAALLFSAGPGETQSATGSIEGSIGYPSEEIPAMHIYAIALDGGGPARKVETSRAQTSFSIPNLPPGRYHVIAYPVGEGDAGMTGGWTNFVTCGMTAQCLQHDLLPVTVVAGKATAGIRIEDWYANPGSFPTEATLAP
jgi:hypothetical protein